ncbi:hypothetical protein [Rhodococcus pyridinivorans]|uniref:hypothetical protein n=1 Tax=Rhodococcus pyridinivorans TaxID=103816 RepID=UPI00110E3D9F|nr:hypothetical protein [Rhodococcus pyridinivorans]
MVVNRSLSAVLLRLVALVCTVVVVGIGAAAVAVAQESDPAGESSGGNIDSTEFDEDSGVGLDLLETGLGALACANPTAAALSGVGNVLMNTEVPSCADAGGNVIDAGAGVIKDGISDVAAGTVEKTALSIGNAGVAVLKFALGWWITGTEIDGDVFTSTVATVNDYTFYLQVAALSLSLILLGGRLALARSGAIRDTSEEGLKQMARAAVLAGGASTLIVLGTKLSDQISAWFMDSAVGSDPSRLAEAMVSIQLYAGPAGVGLLFLIGIIGMLGGLMMAFLMLLRTGILVLMAAALPIAGAAGGTKVGSQAYEKMLAWTIAFLLVKPVGAFVIGVSAILFLESAPTLTDPTGEDGFMALSGMITLCAAALVLPALMRLIVPNVGALGGGGSGLAAAGGAAAVGAKVGGMIATGGASGAASGAATTSTTSTTASNSPSGATPSGFGAAGGAGSGQAGGNQNGTPSGDGSTAVGSGGPQGNDSGSPGAAASGSSGAGGSGHSGSDAPVATGAGHQFNRGGFEQ